MSIAISIYRTYNTAGGGRVTIAEVIGHDEFEAQAGYRYRSACGRNYTAYGNHNDPDMCIVSEYLVPIDRYVGSGSESVGIVVGREANRHGEDGLLYEVDFYRGPALVQKRFKFRDSIHPISEAAYRAGIARRHPSRR